MQDDHHDLSVRLDALCSKLTEAPLGPEAVFLLSEIHASLAAHFQQEEHRMRHHHDPGFNKHKVDHDGLLADIRNLIEQSKGRIDPDFGRSLSARLHAWLERHARTHDAESSITL